MLQRFGKMLLCLGEFSGPLIELFLEIGGGGTAMTRNRWRISALGLRCLVAAFFHCSPSVAARAVSDHAAMPPRIKYNRSGSCTAAKAARSCPLCARKRHMHRSKGWRYSIASVASARISAVPRTGIIFGSSPNLGAPASALVSVDWVSLFQR
jgi:hypothetical protein